MINNQNNTFDWFSYQLSDYTWQYFNLVKQIKVTNNPNLGRGDVIKVLEQAETLHASLVPLLEEIETAMGGRPDDPDLEITPTRYLYYSVWADTICLGSRIEALIRLIEWMLKNDPQ